MKIKNIKVNKKLLSILMAFGFAVMPVSEGITETNIKEISIFSEDNISSNQYGANQRDFKKYSELINNPYIWNALQKYFPVESFTTEEEAEYFYKKYFEIIYNSGCGYAVACDYVFHSFEGREKEFEKAFGYPMYTTNENGSVDFNYEVFMLDFFNYSVIKMHKWEGKVRNAVKKSLYEYELDAYTKSSEFRKKKPDNLSKEEEIEWEKFDKERQDKFFELYNRWQKTPEVTFNAGIYLNAAFGYLYNYLAEYHIMLDVYMVDADEFNVDDIVACDGFNLFIDENGKKDPHIYGKIGSHYVYVTDVTEDGKVIVSSWGKKYYFDNSNALWTQKIVLKKSNGF